MFKNWSPYLRKINYGEQPDTTIKENQLDFPIDRADYFFDQALVFYCEENNIPSEKLSQSDMLEISKRAAFHLSIFVAWLAKHDFLNPQSDGLTLRMHKNSRMKRLRVQTISLNILMKNSIHLILVTHSSPSFSDFMKILYGFCYTVLGWWCC